MGGGSSKPDGTGSTEVVPSSSTTTMSAGHGGGADAYTGPTGGGQESYEMDDEVAQQTADLLFDLLPYYGTGNAEADQIFLATLKANDILAHSR